MSKITVLDPGLKDHQGLPSLNLGDVIISEAVQEELRQMFPGSEIIPISSHTLLEEKHIRLIKESDMCFVGGTNLLSSDAMAFRGMPLSDKKFIYLFPPVTNLVLMGVGWGFGYQQPVRFKTRLFYKRLLSRQKMHACRDEYSTNKLNRATSVKTINTCCPTTWKLRSPINYRMNNYTDCVLTLTDYSKDTVKDSELIETILENFSKVFFFPQGSGDKEYLESLDIYKKNASRFVVLPHNYDESTSFLHSHPNLTYIGTRLHAGIRCMQLGMDTLIIGVDNRALEIHNDTLLPVIKRNDQDRMNRWLKGDKIFEPVKLPLENISIWKNQFL